MKRNQRYAGIVLTILVTMGRGSARADEPASVQRARVLYDEAVKELNASGPARACPMFEEVIKVAPDSVGGFMMLGECRKRQGRLSSAFRAYTQAAAAARRVGQPGRSEKAAQLAAALEPKLARLALSFSSAARSSRGLEVRLDGQTIAPEALDTSLPVDRGDHIIEVRAERTRRLELRRRVEFDGVIVSVSIDALTPSAPEPALTSSTPGASSSVTPRERPRGVARSSAPVKPSDPAKPNMRRTIGIVTGAVGAAGLLAGSVAGAVAMSRRDASNDGHCQRNLCDDAGIALRRESLRAGDVSTALFVVGGALAAAGVTLALVPARKTSTARLLIGPGQVEVRAAF